LIDRISSRSAVLGVIGLGYVGLPVACSFANAGFRVVGVDLKKERVDAINQGLSPIEGDEPGLAELVARVVRDKKLTASTEISSLATADIVLVAVETPVGQDHIPRFEALTAALQSFAPHMKEGVLVIIESTISPGTTERIVIPTLEKASGKKAGGAFRVGHCPERVMPGKLLANIATMSRVCGASTPEAAEEMRALYRTIVTSGDLDAADCVTAELVKTGENSFRDVVIAFANELAKICEKNGGDFLRVRQLVNKSPGRVVPFAGAGVGGHCIPKDPWLLAAGARGAETPVLSAARSVNESMPLHVADLLEDALKAKGKELRAARIAVLGYAYLENSDDDRNSPTETLIGELRRRGAEVAIHDPWVKSYAHDINQVVEGAHAAVFMVAHDAYKKLSLGKLKEQLSVPVVIDGRSIFEPTAAHTAGIEFRAIGRPYAGASHA